MGLAFVAAALLMLLATAGLTDRVAMVARVPLTKPVEVLIDRAQQIRTQLGYTEPFADDAFNYRYAGDYLLWAASHSADNPWASLPTGRPAAIRFWYRTSPQTLIPFDDLGRAGLGGYWHHEFYPRQEAAKEDQPHSPTGKESFHLFDPVTSTRSQREYRNTSGRPPSRPS